jgi:hypothetical protein
MDKLPTAILLRFPEYNKIIRIQISRNEDFKGLCCDYELCMQMIATIGKEADSKKMKLEEYMQIKEELETEALTYLH